MVLELAFDADNALRLAARPVHREKLAALHKSGQLVAAGPFAGDTGALLVFAVASESEVMAILADDPYYSTRGVTVSSIREWNPVVGLT